MVITPNNFFDQVFCINLKRRTDRKDYIDKEFANYGIQAEFIEAVDGKELEHQGKINRDSIDKRPMSGGDIGCILSHLKACKTAKERNLSNYLVFEDDAEFHTGFKSSFHNYIQQVPEDWDMIYLGGSHNPKEGVYPEKVTENVARMKYSYTSHAIALKHTVYDRIIGLWEKQDERIDICLAMIHSEFNCYAFRPAIVYQKEGHSDILDSYVNYKHLRK